MPARSEYLGIRLTPQERAALERAAKATQLSTSALVRLALRELLAGERVSKCASSARWTRTPGYRSHDTQI